MNDPLDGAESNASTSSISIRGLSAANQRNVPRRDRLDELFRKVLLSQPGCNQVLLDLGRSLIDSRYSSISIKALNRVV